MDIFKTQFFPERIFNSIMTAAPSLQLAVLLLQSMVWQRHQPLHEGDFMADGGTSTMIMLVTSLLLSGAASVVLIQSWGEVTPVCAQGHRWLGVFYYRRWQPRYDGVHKQSRPTHHQGVQRRNELSSALHNHTGQPDAGASCGAAMETDAGHLHAASGRGALSGLGSPMA